MTGSYRLGMDEDRIQREAPRCYQRGEGRRRETTQNVDKERVTKEDVAVNSIYHQADPGRGRHKSCHTLHQRGA